MVNVKSSQNRFEIPVPGTGPTLTRVCGVDFSGARKSGKTAWLAELSVLGAKLTLESLRPLGSLAGSDDRAAVCALLVNRILNSRQTLWGCDFPFGLPVELGLGTWRSQLNRVCNYGGSATDFGRELVARARQRSSVLHIRRETDRQSRTPFDCYHYRIIHQTFHGMRDVLRPIAGDEETAVLPFQYDRISDAARVVVEACPSSTLRRLGLPYRIYKQTAGRPPEPKHLQTRRSILRGIENRVHFSVHRRRLMMQNPGADALDAVLAGLGSWAGFLNADHQRVANHARYPREGFVYF